MRRSLHVLVVPFAAQGHINALMQLSQHLVASHGSLITFVNTEHNHARIMHAHREQSARPYPEIKMVALSDGLPLDDHLRTADLKSLLQSLEVHMAPLLAQLICGINQTDNPITCIIADAFCHWIHDIAESAGVPAIGFFPCSVAQFSLIYHIPLLLSTGQVNPDGTLKKAQETITGIPGLRVIPGANVTWHIGTASHNEFAFNELRSTTRNVKRFKAILFNSYYELEKEVMDALVQEDLRLLPVGPLVLLDSYDTSYNVPKSDLWVQEEECLKWLDDKPKSSVLYIAFGSIAIFSIEELHALALGLEASEVNFLWVLRTDLMNGSRASLPEGFLERTRSRAFVASWVPQVLVLSHPSTGAFLTHCGWNSIMEGIAMGVPMLAWPYFGDQKGNCLQIIEDWKVGMPIGGNDGKAVDQHEVEKIIRSMMYGVEGLQMTKTIANLKEKARSAIAKDVGMSYNNLKDIIRQITMPSNMN